MRTAIAAKIPPASDTQNKPETNKFWHQLAYGRVSLLHGLEVTFTSSRGFVTIDRYNCIYQVPEHCTTQRNLLSRPFAVLRVSENLQFRVKPHRLRGYQALWQCYR